MNISRSLSVDLVIRHGHVITMDDDDRIFEHGAVAVDKGLIVAVGDDGREVVARGTLDGVIANAASGTEGFGFDPVFVPVGEDRTVAELGDGWKWRHSHRARAAAELAHALGG